MAYDKDKTYDARNLLSEFKKGVDLAFTDLSNLGISRIKYLTTHAPDGGCVYVMVPAEEFPYEMATYGKAKSMTFTKDGSYAYDFTVSAKTENVDLHTELENHNIDYASLCPPDVKNTIAEIIRKNLMTSRKDVSKAALRNLAKSLGNIKAGIITKKRYAPEDARRDREHSFSEEYYAATKADDLRSKLEDYVSFASAQLEAYKIQTVHSINVDYEMGELSNLGIRIPLDQFPLNAPSTHFAGGMGGAGYWLSEIKFFSELGDSIIGTFIPIKRTDTICNLPLEARKELLIDMDRHVAHFPKLTLEKQNEIKALEAYSDFQRLWEELNRSLTD